MTNLKKNGKFKVKAKSVDVQTFNKALKELNGRCFKYEAKPNGQISNDVFIYQDNRQNYHLVYKEDYTNKVKHLKLDPYTGERNDKEDLKSSAVGAGTLRFKNINKKYKENIYCPHNPTDLSWESLYWYDTRWIGQPIEQCYEYDQGSSYPSYFKNPLPYGDIIDVDRVINDGEIGFDIVFNKEHKKVLKTKFKGEEAEIIFKAKVFKSLVEFANVMYTLKESYPKDSKERELIKLEINSFHGNLKSKNVYMAAAIIGYAQRFMWDNKPDNCLIITVDSYTTQGPSNKELPMGDGLGQFKIKHSNEILTYYSPSNLKWEDGDFKHKGLIRERIGKSKMYRFNSITKEIIKNE